MVLLDGVQNVPDVKEVAKPVANPVAKHAVDSINSLRFSQFPTSKNKNPYCKYALLFAAVLPCCEAYRNAIVIRRLILTGRVFAATSRSRSSSGAAREHRTSPPFPCTHSSAVHGASAALST